MSYAFSYADPYYDDRPNNYTRTLFEGDLGDNRYSGKIWGEVTSLSHAFERNYFTTTGYAAEVSWGEQIFFHNQQIVTAFPKLSDASYMFANCSFGIDLGDHNFISFHTPETTLAHMFDGTKFTGGKRRIAFQTYASGSGNGATDFSYMFANTSGYMLDFGYGTFYPRQDASHPNAVDHMFSNTTLHGLDGGN